MEWSTVITEIVVEDLSLDDDGEIHVFCDYCDPQGTVAFCGTELVDGEPVEDGDTEPTCVVCADMVLRPCSRCGTWP